MRRRHIAQENCCGIGTEEAAAAAAAAVDDVDDDDDDDDDDVDDDDAPPDRPRASSSSSPRPRRAVVPSVVESSKPDATNNSLCSRRDRFDWFEKNASSALNVNKNAAKKASNRARRKVLRSLVVVRIIPLRRKR